MRIKINKDKSYANVTYWQKYQQAMHERFRLTQTKPPRERWWDWQDARIHLDIYEPAGFHATVILLHGGGGYGRLLAPFAVFLQNNGFRVVAPDLPGYGISQISKDIFSYSAWVDCASDLVLAEIRSTQKPVFAFGLSIGGYLAYMVAARNKKVAGVIATTLADPREQAAVDDLAGNRFIARVLLPAFSWIAPLIPNLRLPLKWFSKMNNIANNPELISAICKDSIGGGNHTPVRFMYSIFSIIPDLEPEQFDVCPLLFMHPEKDRWTTLSASKPFFDRIKGPKVFVLLENCGHFPLEDPGATQMEEATILFLKNTLAK